LITAIVVVAGHFPALPTIRIQSLHDFSFAVVVVNVRIEELFAVVSCCVEVKGFIIIDRFFLG